MAMKIRTTLTIFRPRQTATVQVVDLPADVGYAELKAVIEPLLDGGQLEHVAVLHDGRRRDLFVDEIGIEKQLPRNDAATAIYRANSLERDPALQPETLPAIYGPAVLVDRIVWR